MESAGGTRYLRWRSAIKRTVWIIDRHWYAMLGKLFLGQ